MQSGNYVIPQDASPGIKKILAATLADPHPVSESSSITGFKEIFFDLETKDLLMLQYMAEQTALYNRAAAYINKLAQQDEKKMIVDSVRGTREEVFRQLSKDETAFSKKLLTLFKNGSLDIPSEEHVERQIKELAELYQISIPNLSSSELIRSGPLTGSLTLEQEFRGTVGIIRMERTHLEEYRQALLRAVIDLGKLMNELRSDEIHIAQLGARVLREIQTLDEMAAQAVAPRQAVSRNADAKSIPATSSNRTGTTPPPSQPKPVSSSSSSSAVVLVAVAGANGSNGDHASRSRNNTPPSQSREHTPPSKKNQVVPAAIQLDIVPPADPHARASHQGLNGKRELEEQQRIAAEAAAAKKPVQKKWYHCCS